MKCSVQVIATLILVVINDAYSRPNAGYPYNNNNVLRPQIQREVDGKTDEKYFHYDGVLVPVMYVHESWPKQPSADLSFGDKMPVQGAPFLKPPKPESLSTRRQDHENSVKETDRIVSKLQHLANLKYNTQPDDTRSNAISDKAVFKRMKNSDNRRSKPSKVVTAIKDSIIKEVEADVKMSEAASSPAQFKEKYADTILKPKRVVQQRVVYTPLDGVNPPKPFNQAAYPLDNEYAGSGMPVVNYPSFRNDVKAPNQFEKVYELPNFVNLDNLAAPNPYPNPYYQQRVQSPAESNPLWAKFFPGATRGTHPFLETFSTAVEYGPDSDGCKQRDNQKIETLNRVQRADDVSKPEVQSDKPEGEGSDVTNFTVIIISDEKKDDEDTNRVDKKLDGENEVGVLKNELLHYKDTYKDNNLSAAMKGPLSFLTGNSQNKQGQLPHMPQTRQGSDGPQISTLKVRKGGVAIAGPGGIATAGSGGTAIVGPGGTAYTTADGMAVVGSGGKVVSLGHVGQPQGQNESNLHVPQYQIQYQPQVSPYSMFPELANNRPTIDYRPGLVRVNRHAKVSDEFDDDKTGLDLLPFELILDQKPEK